MEFGEACYLNAGLTPSAEKLGSVDYPKFGLELRIPLWLRTAGVLDAGGIMPIPATAHAYGSDASATRTALAFLSDRTARCPPVRRRDWSFAFQRMYLCSPSTKSSTRSSSRPERAL